MEKYAKGEYLASEASPVTDDKPKSAELCLQDNYKLYNYIGGKAQHFLAACVEVEHVGLGNQSTNLKLNNLQLNMPGQCCMGVDGGAIDMNRDPLPFQ